MKRLYVAIAVMAFGVPASAQDVTLEAPDTGSRMTARLENASLVMSLDPDTNPAPQDYVAAARADYRTLLTALYTSGYYAGKISIRINGQEAAGIAPLGGPTTINRIEIVVDKGPKFTFGALAVAPLAPGTKLPTEFRSGETAESGTIRLAAKAGVAGWRDVGHAKARVSDQEIVANHKANEVDASIAIAPGPELTFGELTITGNEDVRTGAIRRIAGLPVGTTFSPAELEAAARRLRKTGAFDSVSIQEADFIGPGNTLPISLQVVESLPRRFGFGLELSSVEGVRVSAFWLHRNFNGGAQRLRVEGEVSGIGGTTGGTDYRIATNLTIPAIYGPDTDLTLSASILREDEPDYLIDKASIEVIATRSLSDALTVSTGLGLLTAREDSALGIREYTLFTLPLSATYDQRDDPTNAQNGYYLDIDATPFVSVDGETYGARAYADLRGYRTFGVDEKFGLAVRGQIGSVMGATVKSAPADFLFFSGGSNTVRGQPYKSLGTTRTVDGDEITTGGLSFLGAQLEARYAITDTIGVVGFYDVGHVGRTEVPGESGDLHAGVGLGVRYNTGIGPIRLDIGTPATGDNAFGNVQVYIGIGQSF